MFFHKASAFPPSIAQRDQIKRPSEFRLSMKTCLVICFRRQVRPRRLSDALHLCLFHQPPPLFKPSGAKHGLGENHPKGPSKAPLSRPTIMAFQALESRPRLPILRFLCPLFCRVYFQEMMRKMCPWQGVSDPIFYVVSSSVLEASDPRS
jgi:hypothetical protein